MLRRIGLSNFKCWKELDIELAPITLLFGVNSSGKSAVLQSLLMLKQTADNLDRSQHINFGGESRDYFNFGSYRDLVYSHKTDKDISLSLTWEKAGLILSRKVGAIWVENPADHLDVGKSIRYDVEWRMRNGIFINRLAYSTIEDGQTTDSYWLKHKEDGSYAVSMPEWDPEFEVVGFPPPQSCFILPSRKGWSVPVYSLEFQQLMLCLQYLGPLRGYPERHHLWTGDMTAKVVKPDIAHTVEVLIAQTNEDRKLLQEVAEQLRELGLADGFEVRPIDVDKRVFEVVVTNGGVESALMDVGFGVSQVLPVITMLMSTPEGSICLLEQPELHLHPNAQAALADLLLEVAEKRNLQLIVESHSEHIVRRLQRRVAEASPAFAKPENIKMYYCQPGEDGATIDEVDIDRFGQISNWPEKFMGDISGDLHTMLKAALERRSQELERVGSGS